MDINGNLGFTDGVETLVQRDFTGCGFRKKRGRGRRLSRSGRRPARWIVPLFQPETGVSTGSRSSSQYSSARINPTQFGAPQEHG